MMMEALGKREPSLGRSSRDLIGRSCSDSEAEEKPDEVGDCVPVGATGLGCVGVAVAEEPSDAITRVR